MGINTTISAKSARCMADKPEKLVNTVLKAIKNTAEFGGTSVNLTFTDLSTNGIAYLQVMLKDLGFAEAVKTTEEDSGHTHTTVEVFW